MPRTPRKVLRYYAQHISQRCIPAGFPGWHIFDREWTDPQGECLPIARALNRGAAYYIRDSLNALENSRA